MRRASVHLGGVFAAAAMAAGLCGATSATPPPVASEPRESARGSVAPPDRAQADVVVRPGSGAGDLPVCRPDWSEQVASMSGHRRTPVVSAWLRNGVRVHHLRHESSPGMVFVTVSFSGGEMLEDAANRGVTLGACSAMDALSVGELPPACVPAALEGRDVHMEAVAGPDAMQLRLRGRREDIEQGMRVAAAVLRHAKVTPATLAATVRDGLRQVEERAATPGGMVADAIADVIFPAGEARVRPATAAQLGRVTVEMAQGWLDRHLARAPVEVAIVGDVSLDEAMRLAAGFLSDLPTRARACAGELSKLRTMDPPTYPIRAELTRPIEPGAAYVVVGMPGADGSNLSELRTMRVAARVLDARATAALRDAGFADADVGTAAIPGTVYPGFGVVVANVKVPDARADEAADVLERVVRDLASGPAGVSEAELVQPREELVRAVERFEREPRYWDAILARSQSSGVDPDQVGEGTEFYRSVTPAMVTAAVRAKVGEDRLLRLIIRAETPNEKQNGPAASDGTGR